MPDIVNRITKEFRSSVSRSDIVVSEWILDPDLTAVEGFLAKYWIITGDIVTLMDQTTRDALDVTLLSASRDGIADQLQAVDDVLAAFALVVLDEINILRAQHALANRTIVQLKTAVRGKLGP